MPYEMYRVYQCGENSNSVLLFQEEGSDRTSNFTVARQKCKLVPSNEASDFDKGSSPQFDQICICIRDRA